MINCIDNKKKHRCNGKLALHVLDMIDSTTQSAKISKPIKMRTVCKQPKYFSEKEITKLIK
jgi:Holliday junction resolvasome RuvABC ATP-dependent DNA helicase subunit